MYLLVTGWHSQACMRNLARTGTDFLTCVVFDVVCDVTYKRSQCNYWLVEHLLISYGICNVCIHSWYVIWQHNINAWNCSSYFTKPNFKLVYWWTRFFINSQLYCMYCSNFTNGYYLHKYMMLPHMTCTVVAFNNDELIWLSFSNSNCSPVTDWAKVRVLALILIYNGKKFASYGQSQCTLINMLLTLLVYY